MPISRKYAALATAAALWLPVAACGEDDIDQARQDVQDKANELESNIDDLSADDLRDELRDVEEAAKDGSAETKQRARELERKIERELQERTE